MSQHDRDLTVEEELSRGFTLSAAAEEVLLQMNPDDPRVRSRNILLKGSDRLDPQGPTTQSIFRVARLATMKDFAENTATMTRDPHSPHALAARAYQSDLSNAPAPPMMGDSLFGALTGITSEISIRVPSPQMANASLDLELDPTPAPSPAWA